MQAYVNSEMAPLRAVLLGFIDNFKLHEPLNSVQQYYFKHDPPRLDLLVEQYGRFVETLENHGVQVFRYDREPDNMNRPFARDALVVIHDMVIQCSMKNRPGPNIKSLLTEIENPVIQIDEGIVEGGDVILDKETLYVGMGQRTDLKGLRRFKEILSDRVDIQPIQLKSEFLHLDVVFNLLGKNIALIYPPAFEEISLDILKKRYRLFEVTAEEQFSLGTNFVSLTPERVISEKKLNRINDFLRKEGFDVIITDYSEVSKLGGSFRCSTCPLVRDKL